ncbi:MAG: NADH:ubiquinone reductase (Na(+)-transporting) subunit B [Gammaproteobacteria bacterium]|nr:MAG: NADH:ubiquinone reductase (Na(+)-transporting) subunit B [Gammaproteobacteria bacterium]|tara:strand:- start:2049 stop:3272 length:1224 start_codon:yes stop_codon:yes gene_type:complete
MSDPLRNLFDKSKPLFEGKGRFARFFPLFDVFENLFYSSERKTSGLTHVRDGSDIQRVMVVVWLATFPTMFFGMYNIGYQALSALEAINLAGAEHLKDWHWPLVQLFSGLDPNSILDCIAYGAIYFIPIYLVTFFVGIAWEMIFAVVRQHEISEGAFVTTVLFALSCPPDAPLWQVALGISVGLVIGKEIFGGTGKNFLNPALTGRAFLYFAYPASWSGDMSWVAVDGYTAATMLGISAQDGYTNMPDTFTWSNAFFGLVPGSIGETSTVAILMGLAILLITKIASYRIVGGIILGTIATTYLFNLIGSDTNPMFQMPFWWHMVMGGYAFGLVFMATEPVSGSHTNAGRWIYGFVIGFMVIMIRVLNPAYPEGMMLAILFGNLLSPLIDHFVVSRNISHRSRVLNAK